MTESETEKLEGMVPLYVVSHIVGILSIMSVLYWCLSFNSGFGFSGSTLFSWHPLFMTIGLIYLMGNGIVTFRIFRNKHKKNLKLIHAFLNGSGLVFTLIASVAVLCYHLDREIENMYTLHSWIGIVAVVVYIVQAVLAILLYLLEGGTPSQKAQLMPYHVFFGHFIFITGIAAALTGLAEKAIWSLQANYAKRVPAAWLMNTIGLLFLIYGAIICYLSTKSGFKRHPRPEDTQLIERSVQQ